jgi:hypothetical protein
MRQGMTQTSGDEKLRIRLNVGPSTPLHVTSNAITVTATLHHLIPDGWSFVDTIFGGEDGDILMLTGEDVYLYSPGRWYFRLGTDRVRSFLFTNGIWTPC